MPKLVLLVLGFFKKSIQTHKQKIPTITTTTVNKLEQIILHVI